MAHVVCGSARMQPVVASSGHANVTYAMPGIVAPSAMAPQAWAPAAASGHLLSGVGPQIRLGVSGYHQALVQPTPCPVALPRAQAVYHTRTCDQTGEYIREGLRRVEKRRQEPNGRDYAYASFLKTIASAGVFDHLPLDSAGILHINVPHCGAFSEAPILLPFLAARMLEPAGPAKGVRVSCSDLEASSIWWETFKEWTKRTQDARICLEFHQRDLVASALPAAGLTLAIHPGPDLAPHLVSQGRSGNPWRQILENILRSRAPGGQCIFASFYDHEVEGIRTVCSGLGCRVQVAENPYYQTDPMPSYTDHCGVSAHPLRYITIVDP
eukprot:TRINITY_DN27240_c0_g1_i1.p1 TRINITY_DN27240_c0_g1~~TRINITY_DN27240_c0_g1_i1.p1  ORF type:complete len:345 (+),score=28.31 TRINITY_DN27240_c0_g1_i1:59-1036(+)